MAVYRIQNITNGSDKRQVGHNSDVTVSYVTNMEKKDITIKAGDTLFLDVNDLPISVHKLRAKGYISVIEISKNEMNLASSSPKQNFAVTNTSEIKEEGKISVKKR